MKSNYDQSPTYVSSNTVISGNMTVLGNLLVSGTTVISSSGEANTASNLGAGVGIFAQKSVVDLQFKSLVAGTNVTLVTSSTTITISSSGGGSVTGPTGSNTNAIVLWGNTLGTVLLNSSASVDAAGNITQPSGALFNGRNSVLDGQKLDGLGTNTYSTIAISGTTLTQRGTLQFTVSGSTLALSGTDSSATNSTIINISSSGSPVAGPNFALQTRNGNLLSGSVYWAIDPTTGFLKGQAPIHLISQSVTPVAPTGSNATIVYTKNTANLTIPYYQNSASAGGVTFEQAFQNSIYLNGIAMYSPGAGGSIGTAIGTAFLSTGSTSHTALTTGNFLSQLRRTTFTPVGTSGSVGGLIGSNNICWRGNSGSLGGFVFYGRFSANATVTGSRAFVGLSTIVGAAASVEFTTNTSVNDSIGVGYDANDPASAGTWYILSKDNSTFVKIALPSMGRNSTEVYDLFMYAKPNETSLGIKILNAGSGTIIYENSAFTGSLPRNTIFMRPNFSVCLATGSTSPIIDVARFYLETTS